jgi:hypothetical protein
LLLEVTGRRRGEGRWRGVAKRRPAAQEEEKDNVREGKRSEAKNKQDGEEQGGGRGDSKGVFFKLIFC